MLARQRLRPSGESSTSDERPSSDPAARMATSDGSAARKMGIPFAPFLALGGVVALFFGDELMDAYLTLL